MRPACMLIMVLVFICTGCAPHSGRRHGVRHVVQPGQTLYRIGKTYNVPVSRIIAYNHIKDPTQLKVGYGLFIPGASRTRTVAVVTTPKTRSSTIHVKHHTPGNRSRSAPKPAHAVRRASKKPVAKIARVARPTVKQTNTRAMRAKFMWPVKGQVLKKFNLTGKVVSKGIDIAAPLGSKVISAAAGKVIYSGNGITGFGHVIIVEHDHALYSVYGYNKKLLVTSGVYVSAGQLIARVGSAPGSKVGSLHFEVWHQKKAVDPAFYLRR